MAKAVASQVARVPVSYLQESALHADEVNKLFRKGLSKRKIAEQLKISRD